MKKQLIHRVIATGTVFAMAFTSLPGNSFVNLVYGAEITPSLSYEKATPEKTPIAQFSFDDVESGFESNGAKAEGSYTLEAGAADGTNAIYLNGTDQYLTITGSDGKSILSGKETFTISYDAKPDQTALNWVYYVAADDGLQTDKTKRHLGSYITDGTTTINRFCKTGNEPVYAAEATMNTYVTGTDWTHVDVVYAADSTTLYVNGVRVNTISSLYSLSEIVGENGVFYIGKSNLGETPSYYKGWIDNFTIYDGELGDNDLLVEDNVDKVLNADAQALSVDQTTVSENFSLPSTGENGSTISWTVTSGTGLSVENSKAIVNRSDSEDTTATLEAIISMGSYSIKKDFTITILKDMDAAEIVTKAADNLTLSKTEDIYGNITLPEEVAVDGAQKVAAVTWSSSNPAVVTGTTTDGIKPGVVTRPSVATKVTLTATLSCLNQTTQKVFEVEVAAKGEKMQETTAYVFAYFTGSEKKLTDEQIYFAVSKDGKNWTDLTEDGNPILTSNVGDTGVRDPYLVRSPEGDTFYLIATDLSIAARPYGWKDVKTKGSTSLIVWESHDLVNWSQPRQVDVASKIEGAGCAWAPEAFYDENLGEYVVYWATGSDESNTYGDRMNIYYATTRDFYTFSDPVLWVDGVNSVIDMTMIYDSNTKKYYRAYADGEIQIETSDSIYDGWTSVGTLSSLFNNPKYSGTYLEGPELFKYNDSDSQKDANGNIIDTWGLMCDQYTEELGYLPFVTTDLGNMSTDLWSAVTDVNFGTLKKRHGTILAITDSEYDALLEMAGLNNSLKDETTKTVAAKTVTLNKKSATLGVGEKLNLTATVKPANATSKKVTYTSKNTKIATVNSKGVVTAKKAGTTTITVKTANGKTATCKITVKKAPKSVSLSKKKITLKKGQTIKLKTTITKGSATTLTFKSSNKKVVTVTASGKIKALKKGTATITVITHNNKKVKCKVTVK